MRRRRQGTASQAGAVMIWVAVSLVGLLTAAFLAIDAGRLYYTQRDLQRLASLAAVSGVQAASGCSSIAADGRPGELNDVTQLVRNFLSSNGGQLTYLTGVNGLQPVELGKLVSQNGLRVFQPLAEGDPEISAVRVNLTRPQPTPFIGFLSGGGTLRASATAEQALNGSLNVGSTILGVNGGLLNQTLGALVCPAGNATCRNNVIALNVASYATGLANTAISLGQLATAANVSVQDLSDPVALNAQTVVLPQLLASLSTNLGSGVSASTVQLLQNLAAAAAGNTQAIPLGDIIGSASAGSDNVPVINLLDLITALGTASHDDDHSVTPIQLPLTVAVPAGVTLSTYLRVLQPAQASGPGRPGVAQARTSQVRLEIRIAAGALLNTILSTVNNTIGLVGALLGLQAHLLANPFNLGIDVDVVPATAYLDGIQCPNSAGNGGSPVAQLSVRPAIANVAVGSFSGTPTATFSPVLVPASAIDVLRLSFGSSTRTVRLAFTTVGVGGGVNPLVLADVTEFQRLAASSTSLPPVYAALGSPAVTPVVPVASNPQTRGSPVSVGLNLGLTTVSTGPSSGLGAALLDIVAGLLNTVTSLLNPLLGLVNGLAVSLINPVLNALGIQLGAATVTVESVQIGRPQKVATCIPGTGGTRGCPVSQ